MAESMLDGTEMLAAIAMARDARRRRHARLRMASLALAMGIGAGILGVMGAMGQPEPNTATPEGEGPLPIEEFTQQAIIDDSDFPDVDWDHWLDVNPDIVGWITVEETEIDHPIVMATRERPTFYLSHGIDGGVDPKGCVFLDSECEEGLDSMHSVVYGHNWSDGLVFADLAKYADADFATEHREILVQTPEAKMRLSVQCIEIADGDDETNVPSFTNREKMAEWYRERYLASIVKLGDEAEGSQAQRIFTFCTCTEGEGDRRVLVYAIPAMNARAASREAPSTA